MTGSSIIYQLQKNLQMLGIKVHILTSVYPWADPSWREWFKNEGKRKNLHFHYVNLRFLHARKPLWFFIPKILFFFKVLKLYREYRFDIIHVYSSSPILIAITAIYKRILSVRAIHTISTYNDSFFGSFKFAKKIQDVDKVICVSEHMRKMLVQLGHPKNKILYLPLGVDAKKFQNTLDPNHLKTKLGIPEGSHVVLFVGPIQERKGAFTLGNAVPLVLKKNPRTVFVFATYGCGRIYERHDENKNKLIEILNGTVFRIFEGLHNVPLLMSIADVFVLPLTTPHGTIAQPLVLLEAMAAGKAIVATNIEGINDLIFDGTNGFLFEKGDSRGLAKCINDLLSNRQLRKTFEDNVISISETHDVNVIAEKIKNVYEELLVGNR